MYLIFFHIYLLVFKNHISHIFAEKVGKVMRMCDNMKYVVVGIYAVRNSDNIE